jgi:hypothetical protein
MTGSFCLFSFVVCLCVSQLSKGSSRAPLKTNGNKKMFWTFYKNSLGEKNLFPIFPIPQTFFVAFLATDMLSKQNRA